MRLHATRRHRLAALLGLAAVGALSFALLRGGDDASDASLTEGDQLIAALDSLRPGTDDAGEAALEPSAAVRPPLYAIATVRQGENVALRRSPGGKLIEKLGDRTDFGSARSFWVTTVKGDWLGVPAAELGNGKLGWIRDDRDRLELFQTRYSLVVNRSKRRMQLRYGRRLLEDVPVTVGSPGSPTPAGNFAVTDALAGGQIGSYYGCCILALTGHQPNLPPDWLGGDRIAIHGTPGALGLAASSGCIRTDNADMVGLFARVPLGTPVFVRA